MTDLSDHGCRAIVTGASGFLGRRVAACLLRAGARVLALGRSAASIDGAEHARLELRDHETVGATLTAFRPAVIVHAAGAQHHAGATQLTADNVAATQSLLDASRRLTPVPRIVLVSSAAVYGAPSSEVWHEDLPCAPESAYGRSKAMAEGALHAFSAEHGGSTTCARVFNLCGPGQDAQHVCGALTRRVLAVRRGKAPAVGTGPLHPIRDFIDVRDAAAALTLLALRADAPAIVNVGTGVGTSIASLIARLLRIAGLPADTPLEATGHVAGVTRSVADVRRLRALGWQPRYDLDATLAEQWQTAVAATPA